MSTRIQRPVDVASIPQTEHKSFFQRPRPRSGFSIRSSHSRKSSSSVSKTSTQGMTEEKETKRMQSKANPSMAIIEDQPSAVASEMETTLAPIRAIQHRDKYGNPIAEPDRSNPTRSRWERPLDTIRSFEAAVDGSYLRQSQMRNDMNGYHNRRSAYVGGSQINPPDDKFRHRPNSYYSTSSHSQVGIYSSSDVHGISNYNGNNYFYHGRARNLRPEFNAGHTIYSAPDPRKSYEYANSTSGSGSSPDPAYSTCPSSENSSIERIAPFPSKESNESFGSKRNLHNAIPRQMNSLQNQNIPRHLNESRQDFPELKLKDTSRYPIKLSSGIGHAISDANTAYPTTEKRRRSWLGRRLSKVM